MNSKLKVFSIILVIVTLAILVLPIKTRTNKTINGLQCRIGNSDDIANVSIHVDGIYENYLFRNDKFDGKIEISNFNDTYNQEVIPLEFTDNNANLIYDLTDDGNALYYSVGFLMCDPDFDNLLILVSEPIEESNKNWSSKDGLFITAPAISREESIELASRLAIRSNWLSNTIWK